MAAAGELQNRLPVLRRITTKHVRAIAREFFLAGWNVRDLIEAIDHRPDGTRWPHSGATGVGNVGAWLTHRLSAWRTHDGHIHRSPTNRRETQRREQQARTRAQLEQERALRRQIANEPHHHHAMNHVMEWWHSQTHRKSREAPPR